MSLHPGDLVHISATAHVHSTALDTVVLRLPGGTIVRLRKDERGVHIRLAGDLGTPGDVGTERGPVPAARPTTTPSVVDGGPGTQTWMADTPPPAGHLVQPPPHPDPALMPPTTSASGDREP